MPKEVRAEEAAPEAEPEVIEEPKTVPNMTTTAVAFPYSRLGVHPHSRARRDVKLVAPVCEECQKQRVPGWWDTCPHDPYFHNHRDEVVTPIIKCEKCGERVPPETLAHCGASDFIQDGEETRVRWVKMPNTRDVAVHESVHAGMLHLRQRVKKGWRLPEELGLAPMCEYAGCYAPNPTIRNIDQGLYHDPDEAASINALNADEALEVLNERKIAKQRQEARV